MDEPVKSPEPKKKAAKKTTPKRAPKPAPKGPTATCPECGDVREVSAYFDPAVHDERCPTCYSR